MGNAALEAEFAKYVGKAVGPPEVARDPVNEPMIRHWCEAMGDANPVYTDADAAAKSVHGGIVAPPTMALRTAALCRSSGAHAGSVSARERTWGSSRRESVIVEG